DTMSGALTVPYVNYTSARTHYFVVGGEGFVPGSNVDYANTYGMGGAYIVSGSGALVAPVHLPHGAVVTAFTVYYYDNSASDMTVYLYRLDLGKGGYASMASVATSGASTYYRNGTDTSIGNPTVDNTAYSYHVYANCSSWNGNYLRIMGAVVRYTISQAP
ncbi:MAG: hypothetical protein JXA09_08025, partial [Anaerolineae bacterium]|nr:hypothetical protein [Anaerolineae bacterium]